MPAILIELDERSLRDLERVAPTKQRRRAEFIRLAVRHALDVALERATRARYRVVPDGTMTSEDLLGWDEANMLATPPPGTARRAAVRGKGRRVSARRAA